MTRTQILVTGSAFALAAGLMNSPAAAQEVCEVNGTSTTSGTATGSRSLACGTSSEASGVDSTAIGYLANASGIGSTAVGLAAFAVEAYSIAIGDSALAQRGLYGIAIGYTSNVRADPGDPIFAGTDEASATAAVGSSGSIAIGGFSEAS